MPRPSRPTTKPKRRSNTFWILIALLTLLVVGVITAVAWHYENAKAIAADEARFEQADKDVHALGVNIQKNIPPEKFSENKDCVHQHREFQAEPLICRIILKELYGEDNISTVNQAVHVIDELLSQNADLFIYKGLGERPVDSNGIAQDTFSSSPLPNKIATLSKLYEDYANRMECQINYEVYNSSTPPVSGYLERSIKNLSLTATFMCSDYAKSVYYPQAD